jgi:tetraacyldisaccharide 4'-kinase
MSLADSVIRLALAPFSWLYAAASGIDRRRRLARTYHSRLPVVSVGNITVGGAGKSPLVAFLVERLQAERPVLVLSRGYGRDGSDERVWRAGEPLPDPSVFGDEPAMIARVVVNGGVAVGPDRADLLRRIAPAFPGSVVVLDDGFQHRQLARDVDIVVVDDATAFETDLVPAGRLRERPGALARADVVVANSGRARELAQRYVHPERVFDARFEALAVRSLAGGRRRDAGDGELVLVTGIANPDRVAETARSLGFMIARHVKFGDHRRYDRKDLGRILRALHDAPGALLATTLKDAVKLERFSELAPLLHVVEARLRIEDEERFLSAVRECFAERATMNRTVRT